jgi:hypothetical protein
MFIFRVSRLQEGRFAIVTSVGAGCDGRKGARDECAEADDEGVWSWRPLAGAKSAEDDPLMTVTNKSWTPRRARSKR